MSFRLSAPQEYTTTSTQPICLFLAGVGSGKTHVIGVKSGYFIQHFPKVSGFIGANTHMQLSQSTIFRVRAVWQDVFGWQEGIDYVIDVRPPKHFNTEHHHFKKYSGIISFKSGCVVFVGSMDNAKAHDGKEFGWAFLDEVKDTREDDVKDVIFARLRSSGIYVTKDGQLTHKKSLSVRALNPLYILTSPAKVDWLNEWFDLDQYQEEILSLIYDKEKFFKKEFKDKSVVISSTYHNIENLPENYIETQIANRTKAKADMLIFGNPFVKTGGEFYHAFDRKKHVQNVSYDANLPVHFSMDQNVKPYITGTLWQVWRDPETGKTVLGQFAEICLRNPKNNTTKLCLDFIYRYGYRCSSVFYYGDPAGKKADTRANINDYAIFRRLMRKYLNNQSDRVPHVHPKVLKRKDFINSIFEGVYPQYEIRIDKSCKNTILDYQFVKEDHNGKKLKEMTKDPDTGERYEKYGHTSDANDYLLCELLKPTYERHHE